MIEKFISRKLIISVLLLISATVLLGINKIDQSKWVSITAVISGAYLIGQSLVDKGVNKK